MSWLENNQRILRQIESSHTFRCTGEAQGGNSNRFVFTGSFDSRARRIWTGLKLPRVNRSASLLEQRAAHELTIFKIISEEQPWLIPTFPLFYGLVKKDDQPVAIVMEDYTKGGKNSLKHVLDLPGEFVEYGIRFGLRSGLSQIAVTTPNDRLRLMDFYPGYFTEDKDYTTQVKIYEQLDLYTIKASPQLEEL